ncbi:hypothetical protein [Commensalibacter communis]|uniref:hypothetical protein n=1 Tax=Commensalibacter communis TaxID=2972786 RepID=UPI0022FF86F2|nr:hypothetical protein [Commensalibacter communis]CAI3951362.1 unnamed protein product [Commensalibacter communis]CAI3956845.1 unnamed protein product [Commensalibacter communis]
MQIIFPHWYDDLYEFESEARGCLLNFTIIVDHQEFYTNFYNSARFGQECEVEIKTNGYFQDSKAVILEKVNKANIQYYFEKIIML